jgi:hypothetical protein
MRVLEVRLMQAGLPWESIQQMSESLILDYVAAISEINEKDREEMEEKARAAKAR